MGIDNFLKRADLITGKNICQNTAACFDIYFRVGSYSGVCKAEIAEQAELFREGKTVYSSGTAASFKKRQ